MDDRLTVNKYLLNRMMLGSVVDRMMMKSDKNSFEYHRYLNVVVVVVVVGNDDYR